MGLCDIAGIVQGKRRTVSTESDPSPDRHLDLIDRQWNTPTRPDQWWVADFTYVWTLVSCAVNSFPKYYSGVRHARDVPRPS